jgi:hypothetical protein
MHSCTPSVTPTKNSRTSTRKSGRILQTISSDMKQPFSRYAEEGKTFLAQHASPSERMGFSAYHRRRETFSIGYCSNRIKPWYRTQQNRSSTFHPILAPPLVFAREEFLLTIESVIHQLQCNSKGLLSFTYVDLPILASTQSNCLLLSRLHKTIISLVLTKPLTLTRKPKTCNTY